MSMRTVLAAALLASAAATAQTPASPTTLARLRDDFRPLLVFAASPDDPALLAQLHLLKDSAAGLAERNVLVIAVPFHTPSQTPVTLTPEESAAARLRFHVLPTDFAAILLGKDGGEKLRSVKPLSFAKLRDTIDAMPMRKDEMRAGTAH